MNRENNSVASSGSWKRSRLDPFMSGLTDERKSPELLIRILSSKYMIVSNE
jgi:hypothetical protein